LGTKSKSSVPDPSNILLPLDPDQMNQIKLIKIIQKILNKQNKKKASKIISMEVKLEDFKGKPNKTYKKYRKPKKSDNCLSNSDHYH
jgi:hypothetical protein